jgi:hypothetical protein
MLNLLSITTLVYHDFTEIAISHQPSAAPLGKRKIDG